MTDSAANAISAYSTLAIAFLTLGYVGVSWFTLRKISKQVEAAEKNADAALLNAKALINGERAWLTIEDVSASPDFVAQTIPVFVFRIANYGRTPGFVHLTKAYVQYSDSSDAPPSFDFMNREESVVRDLTLTPDINPVQFIGNDLEAGTLQFNLWLLSDDDRAKLLDRAPRAFLWAVGSIHYSDVFGGVHNTPFAYWWSVANGKFIRSAFPGLNQGT